MKKCVFLLAIAILLITCQIQTSAECAHAWQRYKAGDRQYSELQHYACYECTKCYETKFVLENHRVDSIPNTYTYGTENICYAIYTCKTCNYDVEIPTKHNYKEYPVDRPKYFSEEYHTKHEHRKCTKCNFEYTGWPYEKHNLGFHWAKTTSGEPCVYYGCDICHYIDRDRVYVNSTKKYTLKKKYYQILTFKLLKTDYIKSIKVISGKKRIKVKKLSKGKIKVDPKKKGSACFKVYFKSGLIKTLKYKIKK